MFAEIERVWDQLGRQPKVDEFKNLGKYSITQYQNRFGSWIEGLEKYSKWIEKDRVNTFQDLDEISPDILVNQTRKKQKTKKVEYGEPIDFMGLRHAPLNEQGVVYLFGILSRKLGFIIEAVRTNFPDCEGKRQIPNKEGRWERVSIEFEFKSSSFKEHSHDLSECDVIVCWENDWKDCPIEVIALKEIMEKIKKQKNKLAKNSLEHQLTTG